MKTQNILGFGKVLYNNVDSYNALAIFTGSMPTEEEFKTVIDMADAITKYSSQLVFHKTNFLYLSRTYSEITKKCFLGMQYDALEFEHTGDGVPTWFIFGNDVLIMSDSIGIWGDTNALILEDKNSGIGNNNIVKDFNFSFADVMTSQQYIGA